MTTTLQKKIRQVEEQHAEETLENHLRSFSEKEKNNALLLLGGIGAVERLAQSISATLSSQSLRALEKFQEQGLHQSLGYDRFDDFLNESDYSPMSKHQFYERKKILNTEGDEVFDLLNAFGIPLSKRKLLGQGHIQIDGDTVIVVTGEFGEEQTEEIEITDRARLLETLSALADANADKSKKLVRKQAALEKAETEIKRLDEENDDILAHQKSDSLDPHSLALLNIVSAFQTLKNAAENLKPIEKEQFAPRIFETIARQLDGLSVAYNRTSTLSMRAENLAHDDADEDPTARQIRLHKKAVAEAQERESKKFPKNVAGLEAEIAQANDDELADLMD